MPVFSGLGQGRRTCVFSCLCDETLLEKGGHLLLGGREECSRSKRWLVLRLHRASGRDGLAHCPGTAVLA